MKFTKNINKMTPYLSSILRWFYRIFSQGIISSNRCPSRYVEYLLKKTFFTRKQIEYLYQRFCYFAISSAATTINISSKKTKLTQYITRKEFFQMHTFLKFPFYTLMFDMMFGKKTSLTFLDMVRYLSLFEETNLPIDIKQRLVLRRRKLLFLFRLLDLNGDEFIDREDMTEVLKKLGGRSFAEQTFVLNIMDVVLSAMNSLNLYAMDIEQFYTVTDHMQMETCVLLF